MEALWQDLKYASRMFAKHRGFTAIAVLTLALGMGANTAIFSVVNAVLLRPLPFRDPGRLVWAWGKFQLGSQAAVSPADFLDYRAQSHVFEQWGAIGFENELFNLTGNDKPQQVKGALVTSGFFEVLGVKPQLGRTFLVSDEQAKDSQVVVLSQHLWQGRFGGDPGILGKTVQLDATSMTVVGVLHEDLPLFSNADLWVPAPFLNEEILPRHAHLFRPIGLLKTGMSLSQAQAELDTIAARLAQEYPGTNTGWGLLLAPLQTVLVGNVRPALLVLLGAVALVLFIACANVASLVLARNSARAKELAVRKALGAVRSRLVRQLLTESVLLAIAGGAGGLLLAGWTVRLLKKLGPESLPRLNEVSVNGSVLIFTAALAILTGILCGLAPALQSSRRDLTLSLKEGGGAGNSKSKHRAHDVLVMAEVALSLIVLIASGLLLNSFWRLVHVNPGFDPSNTLTTQISLLPSKYDKPAQRQDFQNQLQARIEALPGVNSAGVISELPLAGQGGDKFFTISERPPTDPNDRDLADFRVVDGKYFRTMRIPLLAGREFTPQDAADAPGVVLINEPLAKRYFPGENPIGKNLEISEGQTKLKREIVGVVGGNKQFVLQEQPRPEMFIPHAQHTLLRMNLVVRTSGDSLALASAVRETVHALDPDEATSSFHTMGDIVLTSTAADRFNALLLGAFGGIALLLTAAGIFGVLSYLVTQRTREIGLRMVLGAQPGDILRVVVGHGMRLALIGEAIGLIGAYLATHWMSSFLFDVKSTDPLTFAAVLLLLATTSFLACYFPARRAMRVEPIIALRNE